MCGIAAMWGDVDEAIIRRMMRLQFHRGPDAAGMWRGAKGVLGHQRLSIMDPDGGRQPIVSTDKLRAVAANGEIYNFPRLHTELSERHCFSTGSDTESILHMFEDVFDEAPEHLDGMFAFVVAEGKTLYAARDTVGIKPLYMGRGANTVFFASELKAFSDASLDVEEFPPGTWYDFDRGFCRFKEIPTSLPGHQSLEEQCRLVRNGLEKAVRKRLMSDVPVGAFLSGGLDSSLIAAIARRHLDELHTFSVGLEGSRDIEAARVVANALDTVHHEYVFTEEEVKEALPEILYHLESFDQDLVRSAIPCYFVSRLAAEHVKVVLTGEGADELFAGYTYYKGVPDEDVLQKELYRSVSSLHNVNLQRVDRMTMAHSLEGRVPFLDLEMIELAQRVPAGRKLKQDDNRLVEKWILRKACEDLLPQEIVWRKKEQFDEGSGTVDMLDGVLDTFMQESSFPEYRRHYSVDRLRSREEAVFHKLLVESLECPDIVLKNVARWADRPFEGAFSRTAAEWN